MSRPVRTCTGCRERGDKAELIRVVAADGVIRVDPQQVLPGRGAYLHRSESCLDRALKRRAIGRALRADVDAEFLDTDVRSWVRAQAGAVSAESVADNAERGAKVRSL